jgi:hypothetical protein
LEPRPPQDHDTAVQCSPCRKGRLRWDHYSRKTKPLFQPVAKWDSDGTAAPETTVEPTTKWGTTWDDCLAPEIRQLFSLLQSWDRCLREMRPLLNLPQSGIQMVPLPPQNQTLLFDSFASYLPPLPSFPLPPSHSYSSPTPISPLQNPKPSTRPLRRHNALGGKPGPGSSPARPVKALCMGCREREVCLRCSAGL